MSIRIRKRVLEYVAEHPGASATQIGRGLGMQVPAVRHHLRILGADKRVEARADTGHVARGRPRLTYRVPTGASWQPLAMVARSALRALERHGGAKRSAHSVGEELARHFAREAVIQIPSGSVTLQLGVLIDHLNQLDYQSHWEAGRQGPRIVFGRCPYAAIVNDYPELCSMDERLIASLTTTEVHQESKIAVSGDGPATCVFSLRKH